MLAKQSLAGKVAVVTGGSRGIGAALALKLGGLGAKLVVNYRSNKAEADAVVAKIVALGSEAVAIAADMAEVAEIKRLFAGAREHFGKVDILCSNAGIEHFAPFGEVSEAQFDAVFAVNTKAQFFAVQEAATSMPSGGRIVCTSSVSASHGFREHAVYGGSKCAIEGFVRNLAVDLGARGITINAIAPGATKTDMYSEAVKKYGDGSDVPIAMQMARLSPLGRVGTPDDIANTVAFLVSEEGGWMTGQVLHVTGGMA